MVQEIFESKNIPVILSSASGHFAHTGQMGVSSFRSIGNFIAVMVPRQFAEDADKEAEIVLGETWTKAKVTPDQY